MKSHHRAPAFMAESFWSKAATPRHAFHCVFAASRQTARQRVRRLVQPIVRCVKRRCRDEISQSSDGVRSNFIAPFRRTRNQRSQRHDGASLKPSLLEMLTAHRFASDHTAGILTDFESSRDAVRREDAKSSRFTRGKLTMKPNARHAAARTAGRVPSRTSTLDAASRATRSTSPCRILNTPPRLHSRGRARLVLPRASRLICETRTTAVRRQSHPSPARNLRAPAPMVSRR